MISSFRVARNELFAIILLFIAVFLKTTVFASFDIPFVSFESIFATCQNLYDFNLAITIAFLVTMVTSRSFRYKERDLPVIAQHSALFFITNSLLMSIYPNLGSYAIALVLPLLLGNLFQLWNISRHILGVI